MPWGTTLSVDMANMNYKKDMNAEYSTEKDVSGSSKCGTIDESDDLDSFFNDLERDGSNP